MTDYPYPDPIVEITGVRELARDLRVIPDRSVPLVPNIGVIGGRHSVLVVDTGLGPANAEKVLTFASGYAHGRTLYLTTTHFHPEHSFGAQVFAGEGTYVINRAQAEDLATRGPGYLGMFGGLGEPVAKQLEGTELATPDVVYDDHYDLDLGGRVVRLRPAGQAHTKGDQVVTVPDADVMFTGDLVEAGQFAIFPWFPPHDIDVSGTRWIAVMQGLAGQNPTTVVPGHGGINGPQLLTGVLGYLTELRDETWKRRDSAMPEETIAEQVTALMIERHPGWMGQEWIRPGVACLYTDHAA
jgi:glyoxylase-like metal-dependent hydrolase (beta-lactamase superfamily II)